MIAANAGEVGHVLEKASRRRQAAWPIATFESRIEATLSPMTSNLRFTCLLSREADQ
jgi:hypothetical protein